MTKVLGLNATPSFHPISCSTASAPFLRYESLPVSRIAGLMLDLSWYYVLALGSDSRFRGRWGFELFCELIRDLCWT